MPSSALRAASTTRPRRRLAATLTSLVVALTGGVAAVGAVATPAAGDSHRSPALVGSLQSEIGCPEDWQPACAESELAPTDTAGLFAAEFTVPGGTYEYKVALNDTWDEAYGLNGGHDNIPLTLAGPTRLRVTYDDTNHRIGLEPLDLAGEYTAADDALVVPPVRQPGSDERFYFVLTDRFANGDPTNDTGGITGDRLDHGLDRTDKGFYHGGDIAGLIEQLDYIEGLGTSAIWLTPSFKNQPVQGVGENASAGYHGYWVTDFTQIDPHLGTNAELEQLIDDAHARGIKVYFDIITNHTADVIDYAEGEYDYIDMATEPYRTADGEPFDPGDFAGTGDFPELDPAVSFPYTPVLGPGEEDLKVPGWLNDVTLYHNRGDSTFTGESVTFGDFIGLDDVMTEHPRVVDGFIEVYQDWVDLGIDGFRIDTAKHVNFEFWEEWSAEVLDYAHSIGNDEFFMFGEVFDADPNLLSPYVRRTDMNSVLDFTFQSAASNYVGGTSATRTLEDLFAGDDLYTTPDSSAYALPTFLGNHDMGRIGYFQRTADNPLERSQLAHSLMYLSRGQPVVYYGDEQGFIGDGGEDGGNDKSARQSLFASEVTEYVEQPLLTGETAGAVDRYDTDAPLYEHIAELAALREEHEALGQGAQIQLLAQDNLYAFARVDRDEKVEHLVVTNNAGTAATAEVTTLTPGATYTGLYGTDQVVTADAAGLVRVEVPARSAVVLVADGPVAAADDVTLELTVPVAGGAVRGVAPVAADTADRRWAETSFAYRVVGATEWTPLGTADDADHRVFHDVTGLAAGTLVEYRAVTVDAAGDRAADSTYASVGHSVNRLDEPMPEVPEFEAVSVPGNHNSEMGCAADWEPACPQAQLTERADGVWAGTYDLPASPAGAPYEFKIATDESWTVNYGAGGVLSGGNVRYTHTGGPISFYFDPVTKYFFNTSMHPVMALAGSFQSELGCAADWAPDCLLSLLTDLDGDGIFTFTTDDLAPGGYELKVTHGLSWDENYGAGGAPNGGNIAFTVTEGEPLEVTYDPATHLVTFGDDATPEPPTGTPLPHRILDVADVAPGEVSCFGIAGADGVPAGATGVVLNVTAVRPDGAGYAVVYPHTADGDTTPMPATSTVNFEPGQDVASATFVPLPAHGRLCHGTRGGTLHRLVVDLVRYVHEDSGMVLGSPTRLLDTRPLGVGEINGPIPARTVQTVQVAGRAGVPADAEAVVLNVTVAGVTDVGNLRVYPGGAQPPNTSVVNYAPGVDKANATVVPLADDGTISLWSDTARPVHVILDVLGHTEADSEFTNVAPTRVLDTRPATKVGGLTGPLDSLTAHSVNLRGGVVPAEATGVVLNVTAIAPTTTGNLRVYADTEGDGTTAVPEVSRLNYIEGRAIPNLVVVDLPANGHVNFWSEQLGGASATVDLAVDVVGYLAP